MIVQQTQALMRLTKDTLRTGTALTLYTKTSSIDVGHLKSYWNNIYGKPGFCAQLEKYGRFQLIGPSGDRYDVCSITLSNPS